MECVQEVSEVKSGKRVGGRRTGIYKVWRLRMMKRRMRVVEEKREKERKLRESLKRSAKE